MEFTGLDLVKTQIKPSCCRKCKHCDVETGELGEEIGAWYCELNIYLPTTKGTCKKQTLKRTKERL